MKLRKITALLCVLIFTVALNMTAFAATVELPAQRNAINNATQEGWLTNGVDGITADLTAEQLTSAKYLVLELGAAPTGGMQFIWQGDGDGWAWNQTEGIIPDSGTDATTIVIDFAASAKNYDAFKQSTQIKLFLGYYSNNVADLQITRAYLTDTDPAAAAAEPAAEPAAAEEATIAPVAENPPTGDNAWIYVGVFALIVTAAGAVFFIRKARA